jgi:cob(I)alamin adenosyltransferase
MSIAIKQGVAETELSAEAHGTVDELNAVLGFARSICQDKQIVEWTDTIQRTLLRVSSALTMARESEEEPPVITPNDIDMLTGWVQQIEAMDGILSDWSLPGAHTGSAVFEVARTVCRRAERAAVRFVESGGVAQPTVVAYLNRLSDVIWLFGRLIEFRAGIESRLRPESKGGPNWSRAW